MSKQTEFMQGYANWLEESKQELQAKLSPRKIEDDYTRYGFKEDGSVWKVHKTRRATAQEYYQNWINVTPWKKSAHYVEI
jgi:hypothetical protein